MQSGDIINDGSTIWKVTSVNNESDSIFVANGSASNGTRNIGELVYSTMPLKDAGLHLLDGALIQGNGVYSDFVNYIKSIYTEDSPYFYHDKYITSDFANPVLSTYNMIGGDKFAVFADKQKAYEAYRAFYLFDGRKTSDTYCWCAVSGVTTTSIVFYNPVPIKVTNLRLYNINAANYNFGTYTIYGSNNGRDWEVILNGTNNLNAAVANWNIVMTSNKKYYKWYKIYGSTPGTATLEIRHIDITATYKDDHNNDLEFIQPIMSDDYPPGLDHFGVYCDSLRPRDNAAWRAFEPSSTPCLWATPISDQVQNFFFYNPDPINVRKIRTLTYAAQNLKSLNLYGWNEENEEWVFIGNSVNTSKNAEGLVVVYDWSYNTEYYRTYKVEIEQCYYNGVNGIRWMELVAKNVPVLKTAEEQYFDDLHKYGIATKFLYDNINNTVRLPKVQGYISATTEKNNLGSVTKEKVIDLLASYYGFNLSTSSDYTNPITDAVPRSTNYYLYIVLANSIQSFEASFNLSNIAEELDNKINRNELSEAAVVIESFQGESSWYRLYSDGWVEQGGFIDEVKSDYQIRQITFLKPFRNNRYNIIFQNSHHASAYGSTLKRREPGYAIFASTYSYSNAFDTGAYATFANWYACGYAATED